MKNFHDVEAIASLNGSRPAEFHQPERAQMMSKKDARLSIDQHGMPAASLAITP
jgi:hypothetical protein